ncbi:putative GTPase-activating protein [Podospora australis]|uniref:GTPase-activating protein n=1 Tax=Podospora australis TaxID=1536484 RepID=A0AAN7AJ57_9PEZI|nr:putative GTPase-activating protein [Podospora australis]
MNTGCFAASNAIARTSVALSKFVREVRESRSELDTISSELHSLDGVLEILRDDAASFPPFLAEQTPSALDCCLTLINELEGCIAVLNRPGVSRVDKKSRWQASRDHINRLHWTLGRYNVALGLAVDFVGASKPQTNEDDPDVDELADVAARIIAVTDEPQPEMRQTRALTTLQQYFDTLREYANLSAPPTRKAESKQQLHELPTTKSPSLKAPSSAGEAPDSAIEMGYDEHSFSPKQQYQQSQSPPPLRIKPSSQELPVGRSIDGTFFDEMDEFSGELHEMPPNGTRPTRDVRGRVPPPPPRSSSRLAQSPAITSFNHHQHPHHRHSPSDTDSNYHGSVSNAGGSSIASRNSSASNSTTTHHKDSRIWSFGSPPHSASLYPVSEHPSQLGYRTAGTELSSHGSQSDSHSYRSDSRRSSGMNQSQCSVFENPRPGVPPPSSVPPSMAREINRPPTATSSSFMNFSPPSSPRAESTSGRRTGSRLGSAFSRLGLRSKQSSNPLSPSAAELVEAATAGNVFGVPLANSMRVAKGLASTTHDTGGSGGGRGARDYPLCILRCVYYIKDMGLDIPHVFGQDGDFQRVAALKEIFSSADTGYGKMLDWRDYTVFDAADLILVFLNELPKPLIPESLAKRWVKLSKQATVAGSMALRIDQGIDFWEESMMGIKGPERALFKLLLNMWGDIADLADKNEMTAERLAGRVMRPLLHNTNTGKEKDKSTDLLLGLAFMIRKRSEYSAQLRSGNKGSGGSKTKLQGLPAGF